MQQNMQMRYTCKFFHIQNFNVQKKRNPWSDLCRDHNISFTPLSPYIDKELLYYTPLYVDGTAIEKTGFKYEIPEVTKDLLVESIKYYEDLNLFPKVRA